MIIFSSFIGLKRVHTNYSKISMKQYLKFVDFTVSIINGKVDTGKINLKKANFVSNLIFICKIKAINYT